eukprot:5459484-Alexandrium_andersonii.AAC.1
MRRSASAATGWRSAWSLGPPALKLWPGVPRGIRQLRHAAQRWCGDRAAQRPVASVHLARQGSDP